MASNSSGGQPQVPPLTCKNYEFWSIKLKTHLCSQDLWDLVQNGYVEPPYEAAYLALTQAHKDFLKNNHKKDVNALSLIQQAMDDSIFPRIASVTKSKEAWDILETNYQDLSKVKVSKLQTLRKILEIF